MKYRYEIITFEKLGKDGKIDRVVRNIVSDNFDQAYSSLRGVGNFVGIEAIIRREPIFEPLEEKKDA